MNRHIVSYSLQLAVFVVALNGTAVAQGIVSSIRGVVVDSSGGAVQGAAVHIENVTKGWSRATLSGANGGYEFVQLTPADEYTVRAEYKGFRQEVRSGIVLRTGQESRIDLTLTPGDVANTVVVEGNITLVQSEDASVGSVVDERKVKELPLNGRVFWQLSQLVPNVFPPTQNSSIGFRGGFNVGGNSEVTNNYLIDGIDNSDEATMQPVNRPSVEGIQEFRLLTGIYNAEYGRYSGGQVLITTKSGSNEFHGTAYNFLRNSALDARNFFSPSYVPAFRQNDFGFSNGGRILKNRTFYFVTYEGLRSSNQVNAVTTVPTIALGSGNLAGLGGTIKDPQTGAPFPNNVIPASRLDPTSQKILQYWPSPTAPGLTSNYTLNALGTQDSNQVSGRVDQVVTSKNNLFVSYQFGQRTTFYPSNTLCSSRLVPGFGCSEPERDQLIALNDAHVFGAGLVNELRLGYNRIRTNRNNEDAKFGNAVALLGIPQGGANGVGGTDNNQNLGLPQIGVTGYATLGGATNLPQGRRNNTYNIVDGVSWIHGAHTLKFGFDYKHFIYNVNYWSTARGAFAFNGQYTGNAFADFLLGGLRTSSRNPGDPAVRSYDTSEGFYAQDEWKISRRLTLSYGLRYELDSPQKERSNKISSFDPSTGLVPVANGQLLNVDSSGALVNVGTSPLGDAVWHLYKKNLAPRFGFAWRPFSDDKTVLRGGYGIFYNLLAAGNGISSMYRGIPFRASQTFTNTAALTVATWANPFPTGVSGGGYTVTGIAADFRPAQLQQWSLGVQRELHHDLVLELTYLGSKGSHLPLSYALNQPTPGAGAIQSRRPYAQWAGITWVNSVGNSTYNSLSARLERRYSNGLSLLLSYTYSHSLDLGTNPASSGDGEAGIQDPRNLAANRASSEFDLRHRLVTSLVYELPFGTGKRLGRALPLALRIPISGWQATGILTAQSGPPFTVTTTVDMSNTGLASTHPNLVGNPVLANPTPKLWFNPAAYSTVLPAGTYAYGNSGRNTLRADGVQNLDFGLFRSIPVKEHLGLQFRTEVFNILNHPNFGLPTANISSSSAGVVSQTSTSSRQIQFGLKLVF